MSYHACFRSWCCDPNYAYISTTNITTQPSSLSSPNPNMVAVAPLSARSFGSVNDLDVRFSGGKRKSDVIFTLKKTFVSIRHATSTSHPSREVQMEACLPPEDDGEDEKTAATCARGVSATLAVGNYSPGKNPVLYVRVRCC